LYIYVKEACIIKIVLMCIELTLHIDLIDLSIQIGIEVERHWNSTTFEFLFKKIKNKIVSIVDFHVS
jgi:hypothetical protein